MVRGLTEERDKTARTERAGFYAPFFISRYETAFAERKGKTDTQSESEEERG